MTIGINKYKLVLSLLSLYTTVMKKYLIIAVTILSIGLPSATVYARTELKPPPEPVTVPEIEYYGQKPHSGFILDGKALSDEEYEQYRKNQDRSASMKFYAIVIATIVTTGTGIVLWRKKRRKL